MKMQSLPLLKSTVLTVVALAFAAGWSPAAVAAPPEPVASTGQALAALRLHDAPTYQHSLDTALYASHLARLLGLGASDVARARQAGLLHDLGKREVPLAVLNKPGALDASDWLVMHTHPTRGADLLALIGVDPAIVAAVRCHHERWAGKGYPLGMTGEAIPLLARVVSVADVFSALTTDRPYRKAMGIEKATEILSQGRGTQFEARVVDVFLRSKGTFRHLAAMLQRRR